MNNSFNVEEFSEVINNIVIKSNAAETSMKKISSIIENLKSCIGNQENSMLYQGWDELRLSIDKVCEKYSARKEAFLSELSNYKEMVLVSNDEIYQSVQRAIENLESIASQIDNL